MRALGLVIAIAMISPTQSNAEMNPEDRPVARIGKRVITHREIDCATLTPDLEAIAARERRDPAVLCLEREQQRLQLMAVTNLVDTAIHKLGLQASPDEIARDATVQRNSERQFVRLSEFYRGLGRAALLVRRGEDVRVVYERDVSPTHAMPESEFQRFLRLIPDVDSAEHFIAQHSPEYFRDSMLEDARRRIGRAKVQQYLSNEAVRRGVPLELHVETFWRALADEIGLEILDPRYKPISFKGLS